MSLFSSQSTAWLVSKSVIGLLIIINAFTVDVQGGVVEHLDPKTFPVVKGLRLIGMIAHVPFAKKAGL